jgi:hypothetical protein
VEGAIMAFKKTDWINEGWRRLYKKDGDPESVIALYARVLEETRRISEKKNVDLSYLDRLKG